MFWKCYIDEHYNDSNLKECEVCGTPRNFHAEELQELLIIEKENKSKIIELEEKYKKELNEKNKLNDKIKSSIIKNSELSNKLRATEKLHLHQLERKEKEIITSKIEYNSLNAILKNKNDELANLTSLNVGLENQLKNLNERPNVSTKIKAILWLLSIGLIILSAWLFYSQIYLPREKSQALVRTQNAFKVYVNSIVSNCLKENVGSRYVFVEDINNNGILDGLILTSFNGVDCKNNFITNLYIYKDNLKNPPTRIEISRFDKNYFSYRGFINGKLIFDNWNIKDYNQKEFDFELLKNSHSRTYVSYQDDSLVMEKL